MTDAPSPEPRPAQDRPIAADLFLGGWGRATLRAVVAFVAVLALGQAVAILQAAADPFEALPPAEQIELPQAAGRQVLRAGGLAYFQFHMVATEVLLPPLRLPEAFPVSLDLSLSVSFAGAAMGAMALGGALLFAGGGSVARRQGGPAWAGPLHGMKVALPYAVLSLALSFLVREDVSLAGLPGEIFGDGVLVIRPRPVSSFLWPLLLGLVTGGAGGLREARDQLTRYLWGRRAWGALAGGWTTAWVAVALGVVGLVMLSAVHHDGTGAYVDLVGRLGGAGGALVVLLTVLYLPNLATWLVAGSVGGSAVSVGLFGSECALISYGRFPGGVAGGPSAPESLIPTCQGFVDALRFDTAPAGYFAFLLLPVVASVAGGWVAARRSRAASMGEGAATGVAAGALFALILLGLLVVSRFAASAAGLAGLFPGGGGVSVGPGIDVAFLLGAAWGMAGGALGGLVGARRPAVTG